MSQETTYKVMFSNDMGRTWRLWCAYASAKVAIRNIADLVDRGYDRDLSIWVESHPPQDDCSHMDVMVPGEEAIFADDPATTKQGTLFGDHHE
jgi:hypothetical protein